MSASLKLTETVMDKPSDFELVTPERAKLWLETRIYDNQRHVMKSRVSRYAAIMKSGHWRKGDGRILFGVRSERILLLNGQHRLHAIIESGCSILLEVTYRHYDSDEELNRDYTVMDQIAQRTVGQGLHVLGTGHAIGIPQSHVVRYSAAILLVASGFDAHASKRVLVTAQERDDALRLYHEECRAHFLAIAGADAKHFQRLLHRAGVVAVALTTIRFCSERALEFWRLCALNDGLRKGEPAYMLNQYLINIPPHTGMSPFTYSQGVARCWNAFYENRMLSYVRPSTTNDGIEIAGTPFKGNDMPNFDLSLDWRYNVKEEQP